MIAAGIDIGGTKIEVQLFDDSWSEVARKRIATPQGYPALVDAVVSLISWAETEAGRNIAVGIGAAGLVNPATGLALTANLVATGQPFPDDIARQAGRQITYVNDCRALALSEAVFGAGVGLRTVMSLIIGTGVGGGIAVDQTILRGPTAMGGEFGHTAAAAHVVAANNLPLWTCGCGRTGCIETYIAGPGLQRLAKHVTGKDISPPDIAAQRAGDMSEVWGIWCELVGEFLHGLTLTADPDIIVLGGGLSKIDGIAADMMQAAKAAQIGDFGVPKVALALGGDASGARGAAYAAWQEQVNE